MAAGVEIVEIPGQSCHTPQIILQHLRRKGPGIRVSGTQVHGIGTMGHQFSKVMIFQHGNGFRTVRRVLFLCLTAPGIPGKEGEGIGANGQGRFHHCRIACCGRQMAS